MKTKLEEHTLVVSVKEACQSLFDELENLSDEEWEMLDSMKCN